MKRIRFILTGLLIGVSGMATMAQSGSDGAAEAAANAEYIKVTNERAAKIVATLDISSPEKKLTVRDIIAGQYRNLSRIQDGRDARIEIAEKQANGEEAAAEAAINRLRSDADKKISKLHKDYLRQLSAELTEEQVTKVKDGMTYGVLPLTYQAFQDMLPDLTNEQKSVIMEQLVEAREKAMDGGSSEEKHRIFGKYKGRINNYLSAQGYDLKKAGEEWKKRREAREARN